MKVFQHLTFLCFSSLQNAAGIESGAWSSRQLNSNNFWYTQLIRCRIVYWKNRVALISGKEYACHIIVNLTSPRTMHLSNNWSYRAPICYYKMFLLNVFPFEQAMIDYSTKPCFLFNSTLDIQFLINSCNRILNIYFTSLYNVRYWILKFNK